MYCSLAVVGLAVLATVMAPLFFSLPAFEHPPLGARIVGGAIGVFLPVAVSGFWIGTMWKCVVSRNHTVISKIGWLLLMLITNVLGSLIYYYCFARQQRRRIRVVEV